MDGGRQEKAKQLASESLRTAMHQVLLCSRGFSAHHSSAPLSIPPKHTLYQGTLFFFITQTSCQSSLFLHLLFLKFPRASSPTPRKENHSLSHCLCSPELPTISSILLNTKELRLANLAETHLQCSEPTTPRGAAITSDPHHFNPLQPCLSS